METMFAPPLRAELQITFSAISLDRNYTIEIEKSNLSNARSLKGCNSFRVFHSFVVFFLLLLVVLLPFHFLYTPGVNYNCIETMVFWILCMYKTQWQSINNYCCKMQMKTLREDVSDQMDLAIMMCYFTVRLNAMLERAKRAM